GLRRVPAAATVDVAIVIDGRVPMRHQAFGAALSFIAPNHVVATGLYLEHCGPDAVTLGDEHLVIDDNGAARVDALQALGPPGEVEIDLAGRRLEADQSAAGEDEAPP